MLILAQMFPVIHVELNVMKVNVHICVAKFIQLYLCTFTINIFILRERRKIHWPKNFWYTWRKPTFVNFSMSYSISNLPLAYEEHTVTICFYNSSFN